MKSTKLTLRQLRHNRGFSLSQVAVGIGKDARSKTMVFRWEIGTHIPQPENIRALAKFYKLSEATMTLIVANSRANALDNT